MAPSEKSSYPLNSFLISIIIIVGIIFVDSEIYSAPDQNEVLNQPHAAEYLLIRWQPVGQEPPSTWMLKN
jgi:hypothetical protein